MYARFYTSTLKISLTVVYAPTNESTEEAKEARLQRDSRQYALNKRKGTKTLDKKRILEGRRGKETNKTSAHQQQIRKTEKKSKKQILHQRQRGKTQYEK